jgi:hypothetical protein
MEEEQHALNAFVQLHAPKAELHKERCVFLSNHHSSGMQLDTVLTRYTLQQVIDYFDRNTLTMWLINQIQTYNPDKEVIIGLIFTQSSVLAHVVTLKVDEE